MVVPVNRWGNSVAIRLPRTIAAEAGITHGVTVKIRSTKQGEIIVSRVETTLVYHLDNLLRRVTRKNRHPVIETSGPVGREVW